MWYVEAMASWHTAIGGNKFGLIVMQVTIWAVAYLISVRFMRDIYAVVIGYLVTGFSTLAITFYILIPAMNWFGVVYMTLIWPFWIYAGAGIPDWIAPHMFTF